MLPGLFLSVSDRHILLCLIKEPYRQLRRVPHHDFFKHRTGQFRDLCVNGSAGRLCQFIPSIRCIIPYSFCGLRIQ